MDFQLKVDYYFNQANKKKCKNIQLIALTKNNIKIATDCFVAWTSKYFESSKNVIKDLTIKKIINAAI